MEATASAHQPFDRAAAIEPGYSVAAHILRTALLLATIIAFALWLCADAALGDWLLMPAFFAVANAIEWNIHRGPMHHPLPPRILYKNHTLIHHRAFGPDDMPIKQTQELGLIMMPWYTMLLLFTLASPVAMAGAYFRGPGVAGVFFLTAAIYFMLYETQHALYHVPPDTLRRLHLGGKLFMALQRHHRHHHRRDRMTFVNFNVTFPLMDWLFGTKEADAGDNFVSNGSAPGGQVDTQGVHR